MNLGLEADKFTNSLAFATYITLLIDEQLCAGDFDSIKKTLSETDSDLLPANCITAIWMITLDATKELGEERINFINRSSDSLLKIHSWDLERVNKRRIALGGSNVTSS